ncbi:MAG TPA: hypothetical protein VG900_16310 [Hyphomicrobiaceae bacterium]|jgi:hypothetical protein|nr:hypothetical protein [Hyphomicrobiaceae bacterium]
MQSFDNQEEFWSETYRGHHIAVLSRGDGWLVYLDHILQHGLLFATREQAVAWLRRKVDTQSGRRADALKQGAWRAETQVSRRTVADDRRPSAPLEPALAAFHE